MMHGAHEATPKKRKKQHAAKEMPMKSMKKLMQEMGRHGSMRKA